MNMIIMNTKITIQMNMKIYEYSDNAKDFYKFWINQIDYINTTMRAIRKVQTECTLLELCTNNPEIRTTRYSGYMFDKITDFIQQIYQTKDFIALHEPKFIGNEKKYLNECIDSTFVSSIGKFVNEFEKSIAKYTGAKYAVATSSGTSALHISLLLAGVDEDSEVITQPLTFVATCNAISYCNANPVFVDVERSTMGLCPSALEFFLKDNAIIKNKKCINKKI